MGGDGGTGEVGKDDRIVRTEKASLVGGKIIQMHNIQNSMRDA